MRKCSWIIWVDFYESRGENKESKWRPKQVAPSLALETGEGGWWIQWYRSAFKTGQIEETNLLSERMSK